MRWIVFSYCLYICVRAEVVLFGRNLKEPLWRIGGPAGPRVIDGGSRFLR